MSYFRSYFEKNNTIVKNTQINTAKNPATEIFYGSSFSKYIFQVDFSKLLYKVNNNEIIVDVNTKHTLHLTNTIFGSESFLGGKTGSGKDRASSFDLILFKINENWDEGVGFDFEESGFDYFVGSYSVAKTPSNWYYKNSLETWSEPGIYSTGTTIVQTIHFDNGNENIEVDITEYVNGILSGNTNNGLGLAFSYPYQDIRTDLDKSVAFFTKYTQTFFEPYVESYFDDTIMDNRYNFVTATSQNLYLFVNKNGNPINLYSLPTVDIYDTNNNPIPTLTGLTTEHVKLGVYKVNFGIGGISCSGKNFFYDVWKNLYIEQGIQLADVKQKFIPKPSNTEYQIGENLSVFDKYAIQFYGVQQNEKIKRGDVRKIVSNFRSINSPNPKVFDDVYYRMFIKEGKTEVIVHNWTLMNSTNENFFMLNTENYIPREYFVEIKALINGEEIHYHEMIKFEIMSEK